MDIGLGLPTFCTGERTVSPATIRWWAERAEREGAAGLWTIDHLVKPFTYRSSALDPLTALTYAGAVTDDVTLGTSILILPLRRTATVASAVASLQHLAGRRVVLGLGAGYERREFEAVGVPMEERGPRLSEGVEVLSRLFRGEASFDGRFHDFEEVRIDPVPERPPRILAGGSSGESDGERSFATPIVDRILSVEGWIAPPTGPARVGTERSLLADGARERGVDPDGVETVVLTYCHLAEGDGPAVRDAQRRAFEDMYEDVLGWEYALENCLTGTVTEVQDALVAYERAGVDQLAVSPCVHGDEALREQMNLYAEHLL